MLISCIYCVVVFMVR